MSLGPESERLVSAIELSGAGIGSAGLNRLRQLIESHVTGGELAGIDLYSNGAFNAVDVHLGYAGQDIDTLRYFGGTVAVELAVRKRVAGERDIHHRLIIWVCLGECRRTGQIGG